MTPIEIEKLAEAIARRLELNLRIRDSINDLECTFDEFVEQLINTLEGFAQTLRERRERRDNGSIKPKKAK